MLPIVIALVCLAVVNGQVAVHDPNCDASMSDAGVMMIAFAPAFSPVEGDVVEYSAVVTAADDPDARVVLDAQQSSCCRDEHDRCQDWHVPAAAPKHRLVCHGLNVTVQYKAVVMARLQQGSETVGYAPVLVQAKTISAVSDDEVSLDEQEYQAMVRDVVDKVNAAADGQEQQPQTIGALNLTEGASHSNVSPITIVVVLCIALAVLSAAARCCYWVVRRSMTERRRLPQYEPILLDGDNVGD
ncbi:Uncharacterized protein PBTT_06942 [Plasmodiophora brassicae]